MNSIPPGCVPIHPGNKEDVLNAVRDLFMGMRDFVSAQSATEAQEAAVALMAASGVEPEGSDKFGESVHESVETLLMVVFMREPRLADFIINRMRTD